MFSRIPPAVKNLIIINVLIVICAWIILKTYHLNINDYLGLYYFKSPNFHIWQYITYMFMHASLSENYGFTHVFFNMYALFLFGAVLEQVWGSKRFLIFYFVTGVGAALFYTLVNHFEFIPMIKAQHAFINTPTPGLLQLFVKNYLESPSDQLLAFINQWTNSPGDSQLIAQSKDLVNTIVTYKMNIPCVGASGAVFGVLLGFGMLFPNTQLMLIFPPIPIKAKYFVMIYAGIEIFLGITQPGSQIAHVAHIGGMIFGYFMVKLWSKERNHFY
jgi:membrane associated rhomboid family serine protease